MRVYSAILTLAAASEPVEGYACPVEHRPSVEGELKSRRGKERREVFLQRFTRVTLLSVNQIAEHLFVVSSSSSPHNTSAKRRVPSVKD